MPVSTVNGWTSTGLMPSSSVVSQILGRSGQARPTTTPVATPAVQPIVPVAPGGPASFWSGAGGVGLPGGLPNVPSNNPPGWGGGGPPVNPTGGRGQFDPNLNPDQAYAQYLQQRAFADQATPQQAAYHEAIRAHQYLTDLDPFGMRNNAAAGLTADPFTQQAKFRDQLAYQSFGKASPYAFSYGAAPAYAPGMMPQKGWTSGYNNMAGSGFGF